MFAQRIRTRLLPRRVRVFDPEAVTTRADDELSAAEGGLRQGDIEAIWGAVARHYRTGLHPSITICVRRHGRTVLHRSIGHARGNEPERRGRGELIPATPETLYNLFSASKSVTAMLIHRLDQRGDLHIDDRVVEYVPEFGKHGKELATIRHILGHRAGIALVPADHYDLELLTDQDAVLAALCDMKPSSVPGRRLAYHALTGGFVLAAIIHKVTGKPIREHLDEVLRQPLGFTSFQYGVPPDRIGDVAHDVFTGPIPFPPIAGWIERAFGGPAHKMIPETTDPRFLTAVVPSGNLICTADEACRYFELLLRGGELDGQRIFDRRTVVRATAESSYHEHDDVLHYPFRYGLGFMLGSDHLSVLGPNTRHAFGHMGFSNILVFADPQRDISVALLNNGKPLIALESIWWLNVVRTIGRVIPDVRS